jgi:hypothetical protein
MEPSTVYENNLPNWPTLMFEVLSTVSARFAPVLALSYPAVTTLTWPTAVVGITAVSSAIKAFKQERDLPITVLLRENSNYKNPDRHPIECWRSQKTRNVSNFIDNCILPA